MKTISSFCVLLLLAVAAQLTSCQESDNPAPQSSDPIVTDIGTPNGELTAASIGSAGGTLQSADGVLTVTVPAGALSGNTMVSIQPVSNEAPLGLGAGYRLQPEGTTFAEPVTLEFEYGVQQLNGLPADFLWIVTQAADGSWNALLKSFVDKNAGTVTVETTHFSDWALGKFMDLSLTPSSSTIQKGQSVQLRLAGFAREKALEGDQELTPLIPISGDNVVLAPITTIPPIESRLMDFRIKGWTLNGTDAPVSNSNGSLTPSANTATYVAPAQKPTTNPVAVTVQLEAIKKDGTKSNFMITSSITVVDSDLYLLLKLDGETFEYYQYGFNGALPPDPNNIWLVNCLTGDGNMAIIASLIKNSTASSYDFVLELENLAEGSRSLQCNNNNGNDNMEFFHVPGESSLANAYTKRAKLLNGSCETENLCSEIELTILQYSDASMSVVRGYFSGSIFGDKPTYGSNCITADLHNISGEFNLVMVK